MPRDIWADKGIADGMSSKLQSVAALHAMETWDRLRLAKESYRSLV